MRWDPSVRLGVHTNETRGRRRRAIAYDRWRLTSGQGPVGPIEEEGAAFTAAWRSGTTSAVRSQVYLIFAICRSFDPSIPGVVRFTRWQ